MFSSLIQSTNRKSPTCSVRLSVETLEGRDMMSTLAEFTTLAAVWPPPPPAQAQFTELLFGGGTIDPTGNMTLQGG